MASFHAELMLRLELLSINNDRTDLYVSINSCMCITILTLAFISSPSPPTLHPDQPPGKLFFHPSSFIKFIRVDGEVIKEDPL